MKAEELMQEQISPLKSAYMFTGEFLLGFTSEIICAFRNFTFS